MLSKRRMALTGAGLLALALAAALLFRQQPQAQGHMPPMEVQVGVVTLQPQKVTLYTELAGRTAPYLIAEVRPQVGGIIQKRLFVEGSEVKAGQALYQIDPATYSAALASAKASLTKAQANLYAARLKAERYKDLVSINAVSQQNYDDANAALKQAAAEVESAQAARDTARINLDYTRVTAPISGRIGRSAVTAGALVTANQAASLSTVQQLNPIYVDVTQSSAEHLRLKREMASGQIKRASAGQAKVKLVLDNGDPYDLEGNLQFSEATVDQGTGSITLRAVFPNPKQDLLPGMYVRALLESGVDEQALLVPQQAVSRNTKGEATVMVLDAEGAAQPRPVRVSRAMGDKWLVESGVQAGDQVVVEGLQRLQPGAKVKAVAIGPAGDGQR